MDGARLLFSSNQRHHPQIVLHVDRLPLIADMIGRVDPAELRAELERECAFLCDELQPYMAAFETRLYGPIERLMEGRHSMSPMREEHDRVRRLIASLRSATQHAEEMTEAEAVGLRRILFRLHAILKVHLAEEELYLRVLERNLSDDEKDELARAIDHAVAMPL
jgi:iron-sulfur cluster repair protein YtfE (RIC family)